MIVNSNYTGKSEEDNGLNNIQYKFNFNTNRPLPIDDEYHTFSAGIQLKL
jgi:hypothetical protein